MDEDLGFGFTRGGYSSEWKQTVNCVKQDWDGSHFLAGLNNKRTFHIIL